MSSSTLATAGSLLAELVEPEALADAEALAEAELPLAEELAADELPEEPQPAIPRARHAATAITAIGLTNFMLFLPFTFTYFALGSDTETLWSYHLPFSPRIATSNSSSRAGTGTSNPYTSS